MPSILRVVVHECRGLPLPPGSSSFIEVAFGGALQRRSGGAQTSAGGSASYGATFRLEIPDDSELAVTPLVLRVVVLAGTVGGGAVAAAAAAAAAGAEVSGGLEVGWGGVGWVGWGGDCARRGAYNLKHRRMHARFRATPASTDAPTDAPTWLYPLTHGCRS